MMAETVPQPEHGADTFATQQGFTTAVDRVMPSLRAYARRLTRDATDAEDLLQDTLIRAWNARFRFESGTNLKAWLNRIARNSFLSGRRHSWRSVAWDRSITAQSVSAPASQEHGLNQRDLERAVRCLPQAQREAFMLMSRSELSLEEAAVEIGIKLGTMKSRLSRARHAIMRHLEGGALQEPKFPTPSNSCDTPYGRWRRLGNRVIG
jgi:RNA polymerase sigma-70 factor (ECF subfamily)